MPKDNINDIVTPGLRAEVSWAPLGYVQVATTNEHSTLQLDDPLPDGTVEAEPFSGWYVTLDREGCNRMIRSLRTARDKAYGADA